MSAPSLRLETLKPLDDEGDLSVLGHSGCTCEGYYTQFSFLSRLLICYDEQCLLHALKVMS